MLTEEELVGGGLCGSEPSPSEPVSMTTMSSVDQDSGFSYRKPDYRSANTPQSRTLVPQVMYSYLVKIDGNFYLDNYFYLRNNLKFLKHNINNYYI